MIIGEDNVNRIGSRPIHVRFHLSDPHVQWLFGLQWSLTQVQVSEHAMLLGTGHAVVVNDG